MGDLGPSLRGRWVVLGALSVLAAGALVVLLVADRKEGAPNDAFWIPNVSMEPTYESGDIVLTRGIDGDEVSRGDVIVLRSPAAEPDQDLDLLIKRVVAVAGDEVAAPDGGLLVNGRPVDEPYLAEGTVTELLDEPVVVPPDHVFVLGDNRMNSQDSRWFGSIPNDDIIAVVTGKAPAALRP